MGKCHEEVQVSQEIANFEVDVSVLNGIWNVVEHEWQFV